VIMVAIRIIFLGQDVDAELSLDEFRALFTSEKPPPTTINPKRMKSQDDTHVEDSEPPKKRSHHRKESPLEKRPPTRGLAHRTNTCRRCGELSRLKAGGICRDGCKPKSKTLIRCGAGGRCQGCDDFHVMHPNVPCVCLCHAPTK